MSYSEQDRRQNRPGSLDVTVLIVFSYLDVGFGINQRRWLTLLSNGMDFVRIVGGEFQAKQGQPDRPDSRSRRRQDWNGARRRARTWSGLWGSRLVGESRRPVDHDDSPWAGKASLTHARAGANLGPVPDWSLIVSVRSARPYKEAQLRKRLGQGGTATPEQAAVLTMDEPLYVFAISGIPQTFAAQAASIAQAATLERSDRDPLKATDVRILLFDKDGNQVEAPPPPAPGAGVPGRGGGFGQDNSGISATIFIGFPRHDAITVDDGDVELKTVIGTYNVRRKFKPKEMTVHGALAF